MQKTKQQLQKSRSSPVFQKYALGFAPSQAMREAGAEI